MESEARKKTATITFRFDVDLINKLQREAKNHQVNTNTLATQALRRFLEWDIFQPRIGLVSLNKSVFTKIFDNLSEKKVIEIALIGKDEMRDIAMFMKGETDILSFMSWFEMQMVNSSVQVSHMSDDGTHTFVMKHDLGKNWSLYNKTILEQIFQDIFKQKIDVKYDKNMFALRFSK
ncbi:conserved hypothetical protein [Nitrosotalea sinensis]|uniref:Uncharacterized protein n=1 Tax=Nitrosotalea sinensis TaxID=1499975 RepID=A0A2H1EG14_9ARCH|nr:hypothetical protein [Candidatus Nitrosotalea sinensis]SHO44938.1 conserved hypothetical protein [Candidatus Nitrosotalea sinensis]